MTAQDVRVAQACYNAGFRDSALRTIVAIGAAESDNDPETPPTDTRNLVDLPGDGWLPEFSVGPFRFNLLARPGMTYEEATDIGAASMHAYREFRTAGFDAWSTYSYVWDDVNKRLVYVGDGEGAYVAFLDRAERAIAQVQTQGETLTLHENANGSVDVVPAADAIDGTQPLDASGVLDIAAQCQAAFEGLTSNLTTDIGTAAQRAAAYNAQRSLEAFRRAMGAL